MSEFSLTTQNTLYLVQSSIVANYRDAIDLVEEYHPDAADLYCKVALIMRHDGDFDQALEGV